MRTSIATVCLSGTLEEKLQAAASAGFAGVEIFEQDLIVSPSSPESIAALAAELGLSLDLYQPFRDFEGVDEEQFAANSAWAEAKFQLMKRMGMTTILLCSNVGTATIDADEVVIDQLRRLGDLAEKYDVDVAYEALAWGRFVSEYDRAWDLVKAADHPRIGTCLDSFHILSRRTDLSRIAEIPGEKIFFLQLADAPALSMTCSAGLVITAYFPARVPGISRTSSPALRAPVMRDRCRSKSSMTPSGRPTLVVRLSTACVLCGGSRPMCPPLGREAIAYGSTCTLCRKSRSLEASTTSN